MEIDILTPEMKVLGYRLTEADDHVIELRYRYDLIARFGNAFNPELVRKEVNRHWEEHLPAR